LKTLGLVARYPVPGTNLISSWLPPGGEVAVVGDASGRVGIRQLATGREIAGTNGHRSDVYQLIGATAKPLVFAASGHDREGRIWDLRSLTRRGGFEPDMPFDARTMMPDGSLLAIGYTDGRIDLRNLPSGNRQAVWPAHRFPSQARLRCSCRKAIHKAPSHC
jgi:WD40 repeat protein